MIHRVQFRKLFSAASHAINTITSMTQYSDLWSYGVYACFKLLCLAARNHFPGAVQASSTVSAPTTSARLGKIACLRVGSSLSGGFSRLHLATVRYRWMPRKDAVV